MAETPDLSADPDAQVFSFRYPIYLILVAGTVTWIWLSRMCCEAEGNDPYILWLWCGIIALPFWIVGALRARKALRSQQHFAPRTPVPSSKIRFTRRSTPPVIAEAPIDLRMHGERIYPGPEAVKGHLQTWKSLLTAVAPAYQRSGASTLKALALVLAGVVPVAVAAALVGAACGGVGQWIESGITRAADHVGQWPAGPLLELPVYFVWLVVAIVFVVWIPPIMAWVVAKPMVKLSDFGNDRSRDLLWPYLLLTSLWGVALGRLLLNFWDEPGLNWNSKIHGLLHFSEFCYAAFPFFAGSSWENLVTFTYLFLIPIVTVRKATPMLAAQRFCEACRMPMRRVVNYGMGFGVLRGIADAAHQRHLEKIPSILQASGGRDGRLQLSTCPGCGMACLDCVVDFDAQSATGEWTLLGWRRKRIRESWLAVSERMTSQQAQSIEQGCNRAGQIV